MTPPTLEVAPPGSECPTCGLDVGGFAIGQTRDGATTWDRPGGFYAGPTGTPAYHGGLTHVQDGERCRPELRTLL